MPQLTEDQIQTLRKYINRYSKAIESKEWQKNIEDHKTHARFFSNKLSLENIDKITEEDFREVYKTLWASLIWGNKDWYIDNKLLKPNGLPKIKSALKELLYSGDKIDQKIDKFRTEIQGFGISSISEILNFVFPDRYCLWNAKPKTVLPYLGIDLLPERFFKYNIQSGEDYAQCLTVLTLLKEELGKSGFKNPNFIDLDCLLWYIFETTYTKRTKETSPDKEILTLRKEQKYAVPSSHEEAEYYLLKLGKLLGYTTYTPDLSKKFNGVELREYAQLQDIPDFTGERDRNSAKEIDVIWFDENENPKLCLEVEHTTDITKGLNRLYQLRQFNLEFVIVSSEDKRSKFNIEISKAPYRSIKELYKFISYEELAELYELAVSFINLKEKLIGNV
jgi:hypothetical protein